MQGLGIGRRACERRGVRRQRGIAGDAGEFAPEQGVFALLVQAARRGGGPAQAEGLGAQWLTGWAAYDPVVRERLGVAADEAVVGFIHIGSSEAEVRERERPDAAALLRDWTP